jgi:hypothetical protein
VVKYTIELTERELESLKSLLLGLVEEPWTSLFYKFENLKKEKVDGE